MVLDVECTDGFNFVAEEIDTVWVFAREGEDIDDATPHRELPRFIDEVHAGESIFAKDLYDEVGFDRLSDMYFQCFSAEFRTVHDTFCGGIRERDDDKGFSRVDFVEDFSPQYLVGGVFLFDVSPAVGGGVEIGGVFAHQLCDVVV